MKIVAEGTKFKSMELIFLEREQPDVPSWGPLGPGAAAEQSYGGAVLCAKDDP